MACAIRQLCGFIGCRSRESRERARRDRAHNCRSSRPNRTKRFCATAASRTSACFTPGSHSAGGSVRRSWRNDGQASHLPGLIGNAGQAAAVADARSRRRRARRALDRFVQSRDHDTGAAARAHARGRFRGLRVRSRRLDGQQASRIRGQ